MRSLFVALVTILSFSALARTQPQPEECTELRRVLIDRSGPHENLVLIKISTNAGRKLTCKLAPGFGGIDGDLQCPEMSRPNAPMTVVVFEGPTEGKNSYSARIDGTDRWCDRSDRRIEYCGPNENLKVCPQ